jgi:AdoMet-dependent rRNA methyltransferase SPB1
MTAPIDIGQELEDITLRTGQEDMFDLSVAEKKRKKVLKIDEEPESVDEEEEEGMRLVGRPRRTVMRWALRRN